MAAQGYLSTAESAPVPIGVWAIFRFQTPGCVFLTKSLERPGGQEFPGGVIILSVGCHHLYCHNPSLLNHISCFLHLCSHASW